MSPLKSAHTRTIPDSLWKIIDKFVPSKEHKNLFYNKTLETIANEWNQFLQLVGKKRKLALAR